MRRPRGVTVIRAAFIDGYVGEAGIKPQPPRAPLYAKYGQAIDRDSAYERLAARRYLRRTYEKAPALVPAPAPAPAKERLARRNPRRASSPRC